jgi:EpsD family peptidyl-prolyl cis-trans isomerase
MISALALSACGDRPPEKKSATQVAAKVNSTEISVHQLNFLLQNAGNIPPAQAEDAKRQLLQNLIDQELAVQQALDAKLERTPAVMQALDVARREILSRAYLEQTLTRIAKPNAEETRQFYSAHPELFANRKIFRLEEYVIGNSPEAQMSVREQQGQGKTVLEIINSLRAKGVEVSGGVVVKPAEQISLEIVAKLAQIKEGMPTLFEMSDQIVLVNVLSTKIEPVDEVKALPFIETYLVNKQKNELARETMKQLREKAKIELVGEFANDQAVSVAPAAETPKAAGNSEAAVSKGIAGLK